MNGRLQVMDKFNARISIYIVYPKLFLGFLYTLIRKGDLLSLLINTIGLFTLKLRGNRGKARI